MNHLEYIEKARRLLTKTNLNVPIALTESLAVDALLSASRESVRDMGDLLAANASRILFSKKPSLYVPEISEGEIRIGRLVQGDEVFGDFSISLDDLQHAGIFAATSSGKTTLLVIILVQLPIPWTAYDRKRDLRGLCRKYNVKALRWEWLEINPLQPPPNVPPVQWMTFLADMMAHVFGWFHASENYLLQFMQRAYDAKPDGYPTFRELHDMILTNEETGRRSSEYREVVLNRLASMLIVVGDVIDTETSFPIERLLEENLVIELDGLRRDESNFLVELFLGYTFHYRLANGQRGKATHGQIFDEATLYFFEGTQYRETTEALGRSWLETVPAIIRDYQEFLLCAAQEPSLISHSLMANLRTKFVGYLSEGEDIDAICTSLNLHDDEREELSKLGQRGYWFVKKAGLEPFVIKTEDFPIEKDMTDEELRQKMNSFLTELQMLKKKTVVPQRKETSEVPKVIAPQISPDAWNLLVNVCEHPFLGIKSRCSKLRISGRRIENAIEELASRQLITSHPIFLNHFRPVRFLILTNEALNLLANVGHDTSLWKRIGNVGFEHLLYQVLIAASFRKKGHNATIEKKLASGRRLDVYCHDGKTRTGIEIELTTANYEEKTQGIEEIDELIIIVKDDQSLQEANQFLKTHPAANTISVKKITEFLRENEEKPSMAKYPAKTTLFQKRVNVASVGPKRVDSERSTGYS